MPWYYVCRAAQELPLLLHGLGDTMSPPLSHLSQSATMLEIQAHKSPKKILLSSQRLGLTHLRFFSLYNMY